MKIAERYSHLNGYEFLIVHKPDIWNEIVTVIESIDVDSCKTKISTEKTMKGKLLYSPIDLNKAFRNELHKHNWQESRVNYWVTKEEKLIRKTLSLPYEMQKQEIESHGQIAI